MMIFALVLMLFQEPMTIKIGEAPRALPLVTLDGAKVGMDAVTGNSFFFFVSTECAQCEQAIATIQARMVDRYHCVLVFVETLPAVRAYLARHGLEQQFDIYHGDPETLMAFNIKTLPALLAYRNDSLVLGFYGPFLEKHCEMALSMYEGRVRQ